MQGPIAKPGDPPSNIARPEACQSWVHEQFNVQDTDAEDLFASKEAMLQSANISGTAASPSGYSGDNSTLTNLLRNTRLAWEDQQAQCRSSLGILPVLKAGAWIQETCDCCKGAYLLPSGLQCHQGFCIACTRSSVKSLHPVLLRYSLCRCCFSF